MFDNLTPEKAQGLSETFSKISVWALILGGVIVVLFIGFRLFRKFHQAKAAQKPQYNRTAFSGGCFGIVYGATEDDPAYVAVFDSTGVEISRTTQDDMDQFLGLADENNHLILYTMGNDGMYHKYFFDKEQLAFSEI